MTSIQKTVRQQSPTDAKANTKSAAASSFFTNRGWTLDSIAHLLLFVPFAGATIITFSALDWSAFSVV